MNIIRGSVLPSLSLLFLLGCGDTGPGGLAETDESDEAQEWVLADMPSFTISEGSVGNAPFQVFRAEHGAILEDGSSVVGLGDSNQLLLLDPAGRVVRLVGRTGEGPGEFGSISGVSPTEDGFVVFDLRNRRVSVFNARGDLDRVVTLEGAPVITFLGVMPDGQFVAADYRVDEGTPRLYLTWDAQGNKTHQLTGPPEPPSPILRYATVIPRGPVTTNRSLPSSCVPVPQQVVVGAEVFSVDPIHGLVQGHGPNGTVREVYQGSANARVTQEVQDSLRESLSLSRPPPPDTLARFFDERFTLGTPLPLWQSTIGDPAGTLWLERADCSRMAARRFDILSAEGGMVATVTMRDDLLVLAVRGDRILTVRSDELGVEYLESYQIHMAGSR